RRAAVAEFAQTPARRNGGDPPWCRRRREDCEVRPGRPSPTNGGPAGATVVLDGKLTRLGAQLRLLRRQCRRSARWEALRAGRWLQRTAAAATARPRRVRRGRRFPLRSGG